MLSETIDPAFSYVIYFFSSICGWSLVTLFMLMGFANNSEATALSSYKSLASKIDYHKMLSLDPSHKLCKYCVKIFLYPAFLRLRVVMFCENRGCMCYDSLKQGQIYFLNSIIITIIIIIIIINNNNNNNIIIIIIIIIIVLEKRQYRAVWKDFNKSRMSYLTG